MDSRCTESLEAGERPSESQVKGFEAPEAFPNRCESVKMVLAHSLAHSFTHSLARPLSILDLRVSPSHASSVWLGTDYVLMDEDMGERE